ncbi:polysaccharide biosynthesis/export family protein [Pinibacter aurantiacus]|uniref:Polysaccharide biosynthesis/export family protein n=1 Tax=Pinibacter aurantiacus TaxID=2851599 RepID=A0A9E2S7U4_9BACT|nr:polysaccharide biosynthesis/export family protein [Pinibacter aurantiacus]MBV4357831.1 polysaccharide biosynthesis/export family protein [Pinibacter aurantiacus]
MRLSYTGLIALLVIILASCGNPKELRYFQGEFDTAKLSQVNYKEPVIQAGDIISIKVYSDDNAAADPYNMISNAMASTTAPNTSMGYEVDNAGNIQMAGLGTLKVSDLTILQLQGLLDKKFEKLLSHPYYNIRFLNFKVTVLGDVGRPGTYTFPVQKVSILDVLGMAGDLTIYGKRDNILIVREKDGKREFGRLNLKSPDIFKSDWFYLQQNDMVYVDMLDKKAIATDQTMRWIGISTAVISTAAVITTLIITISNNQ